MKKLLGIVALGIVAIVLLLKYSRHDKKMIVIDLPIKVIADSDEAEYEVSFSVKQKVDLDVKDPSERTLLSMEGSLSQYPNASGDIVTEWNDLRKLVIIDRKSDPASFQNILHKKSVTNIDNGVVQHFLGDDFPREFMRTQLALLDRIFIRVPFAGTGSVTKDEVEDSTPFKAQYNFGRDEGIAIVEKIWLAFDKKGMTVDPNANSIRYYYASNGRLLAAEGSLHLDYTAPNRSDVRVDLSMKLRGGQALTDDKKAVSRSELKSFDSKRVEESDDQIQAAHELPFDEAMIKLAAMTDQTDARDVYRVFSALKSHVRADPSLAKKLVARILATKERDPSSRRQMSAMFGALAQSKNSDIANTLGDLAEVCPDNYCKVQAIVGLNDHTAPTQQSAAKMIELAAISSDQEVAATALLAAGSIGHKINDQLPELPKTLIKIYNDPAKDGIKSSVIAAMGNHGHSEYWPVLEAGLKDKEPTLRAASVYSLRNLPNEPVNDTIVNVIEKDESKSVVREALKAMAYRQMTADEYMKIAVKSASFDNQELQEDAARAMVDAYKANPAPLEGAIKTFHDNARFPNVKVYIETQSKPAESSAQ